LLTFSAAMADYTVSRASSTGRQVRRRARRGRTRAGGAHERLADENACTLRAHRRHSRGRENSALVAFSPRGCTAGGPASPRATSNAQIAVVDAKRRGERQRTGELPGVVDLDEHRESELARALLEALELPVVERADDQQDRVGAERARLRDLVLVDNELLAAVRAVRPRQKLRCLKALLESARTGTPRRLA
jgi:hypothetical protein